MITLNGEITPNDFLQLKKEFEEKEQEFKHKFWLDAQVAQLDDLMRLNYNKNIEDFSKIVLDFLAELTNAYSGVLYASDTTMENLRAVASFACLIPKLPKQKYKLGEDTVGQVAKSREWLLYEDMQGENTLTTASKKNIQSTTLLFLPLIFNETAYGVIELTFITNLSANYQEVLQKVGRNIAIMLESITKTDFTKKLLQDAQEQAERLQAQEEELRQNNEELMTTQEELQRRSLEMNAQFMAIKNSAIAKIEFDAQGYIDSANESFCRILGYEEEEIVGKSHDILLDAEYVDSEQYAVFLKQILEGKIQSKEIKRKAKNGQDVWLNASYSSVLDSAGNITKIIELSFEITEAKKQQTEIQVLVEKLQAREEELRMNLEELETTQEDLKKQNTILELKDKELQKLVAEMKANEIDMQKSEGKFKETIKNFQLQSKEMKQQKELIAKLEAEINVLKSNQ